MRLRASVALAVVLGSAALVGCSTSPAPVVDSSESNRIEYQHSDLVFTLASDWELTSSQDQQTYVYDLVDGDDVMARAIISDVTVNQFSYDYETEVRQFVNSLDNDAKFDMGELIEIEGQDCPSYLVSVETNDDIPLKGSDKLMVSGNKLYSVMVLARQSDYERYETELDAIIDSAEVENPTEPVTAEPESATSSPEYDFVETPQSPTTPQAPATPTMPTTIGEGTYHVGTDIQAGEYKVTGTSSDGKGYWEVTSSSAPDADMIGNDYFAGTSYVTVSDGQYLTLSMASAELVQ